MLLFLVLVSCANAAIVVDLAGKWQNYPCFVSQNISQTIIRAYHSYGAIDTDAEYNIQKSNEAGLATDVYMFPCRGKSPQVQVT